MVALQVLETMTAGFVYAAILLSGGSIWPVVMLHWGFNAAVSLQVSQVANFEETFSAWALVVLAALPLVVVGYRLIQNVALPAVKEQEERQTEPVEGYGPSRAAHPSIGERFN